MIILIVLGLIQALILPGLICSYYVKKIDLRDRLIFASSLSLLLNYLIVWLLYLFNIYNQTTLIPLFAIEILFLYKFRSFILSEFTDLYLLNIQKIKSIIKSQSIDFFTILLILFCIYYFSLLKTNGLLTVFTHWDAVVSWNRWAIELHESNFHGSRGYPLAISILFSIIYTFANETNIQTFAKYVCIYWPFLGGLILFRCGSILPKYKNIFGISAIFYLHLLSKGSWTSDFIFSGLVDPVMAAYGAIFIYCYIFIFSSIARDSTQNRNIAALTILSVASASLIKMTGLILFIYFSVIIFALLSQNIYLKSQKNFFILIFAFSTILAFHWYVMTTFYWHDWQLLSEYSSLQDSRIWIRPLKHLFLFNDTFSLGITALIFIGMFYSRKVIFFSIFAAIPLWLFCCVAVGYDLRATFILFAPFSILTVLGITKCSSIVIIIFNKLTNAISENFLLKRYGSYALVFIIFTITTLLLTTRFSHDEILRSNTEKRIAANNFGDNGNQKLIKIFDTEPTERIISCWQTPIGLPGAIGKFIPTGNCTVTLMEGWLANPDIKYWLYHDEGNTSQPLTASFVTNFLSKQSIPVHTESLGSGFILYSKINTNK